MSQTESLRVAISGSSGLIGSQLCPFLANLGHEIIPLVRSPDDNPNSVAVWSGSEEVEKLSGVDVVVHLAGKPIVGSRWSDKVKSQIRDSRVAPTRELCESLAGLQQRPKLLICASATGIYGNRGEELLDERSPPSDDFLADVVSQWEAACQGAIDAGIRVVHARFGIILSPDGGALKQMLLPAKLFGGSLGDGSQWWSWIALEDALGAIDHAITDPSLSGPINVVSPEPIRNRDFAKTLGKVLGRPAIFPAPAFMLRIALGEMADALLLSSARVTPTKLIESGYQYRYTELEGSIEESVG